MTDYPIIHFSKEITEINIFPGQTITIWLNKHSENDNIKNAIQVELRVNNKGECEIYTFLDAIKIKTFKDWCSIM